MSESAGTKHDQDKVQLDLISSRFILGLGKYLLLVLKNMRGTIGVKVSRSHDYTLHFSVTLSRLMTVKLLTLRVGFHTYIMQLAVSCLWLK